MSRRDWRLIRVLRGCAAAGLLLSAAATAAPEHERLAAELLSLLQSCHLLDTGDRDINSRLVRAILDANRCESFLVSSADGAARTAAMAPRLLNGRFAYLRLDLVGSPTSAALTSTLNDMQADTALHGMVVDVRHSLGGSLDDAAALETVLAGVDLPKVILIGPETRGAPEVLAAGAADHLAAVTIGAPTAGYPVSWAAHRLQSGDALMLPDATALAAAAWMPKPVQPLVSVGQTLSRAEVGARLDLPADPTGRAPTDLALRRAVDLLATITALRAN